MSRQLLKVISLLITFFIEIKTTLQKVIPAHTKKDRGVEKGLEMVAYSNISPMPGPGLQKMIEAFPQAYPKNNGWWEHDDDPTFGFRENENGWITIHSFTGRSPEEILAMRGLELSSIAPRGYHRTIIRDSLDTHELGIAKRINWRLLWNFGVEDGYTYHSRKCVKIVYYLEDGTPHTKVKVRKAINGTAKHCWDEGTPGHLIPYGLNRLSVARDAGYLLIGEGETDAWTCWAHHLPYLGIPGASSYKTLKNIDLNGIPAIYILTEPDQMRNINNGQGFYKGVHNTLREEGYTGEIFCIDFQQATGHKDPSDLHIALWDSGNILQFEGSIENAKEQAIPANDQIAQDLHHIRAQQDAIAPNPEQEEEPVEEEEEGRPSQAHILNAICNRVQFYRTYDGTVFGSVPVNGHHKVEIVGEKGGFRKWLLARYYERFGAFANATAVQQVIELRTAQADETAPLVTLFTRVAHQDGKIYLDLCNDDYQVIEIDTDGWRVLDRSPVHFRRTIGMLPLPIPTRGGSLDELRNFVKVGSDNDWKMIVAYVLMLLHPYGPYPVLALGGEQGSAKSSATRFIRSLIDPHLAISRSTPQDAMALAVTAQNNWVYALENISHVPEWLSDSLCKLSTGAGDGKRKLYTDGDEQIFVAKRPTIINGIGDLVTRGDLLSRTIAITMPVMSRSEYREERILNAEYEQARPGILGAILDATVMALRNVDEVKVIRLSRMADMSKWMSAAEESLGWEPGTFLECYEENQDNGVDVVLDASQVAKAVMALMENRDTPWKGSAQELDKELRKVMGEDIDHKRWPANPKTLSDTIKRLSPALRSRGVQYEQKKSNGKRLIILTWMPQDNASNTGKTGSQTPVSCDPVLDSCDPCDPVATLPTKENEGTGSQQTGKTGSQGSQGSQPKSLATLPATLSRSAYEGASQETGSQGSQDPSLVLKKKKREEIGEKREERESVEERLDLATLATLPPLHDFKLGEGLWSPDGYGVVTHASDFRVTLYILNKHFHYSGDIAIGGLYRRKPDEA